ncbi:MAG: PEP-CTERM sorting domain-containing protein [Phycisphaerae bacterium]|nr:PEP-CTERM sorting domain-containing protein [Phycisphaerae bacterium]
MIIRRNRVAAIVVLAVLFIECGSDAFAQFGARGPNGPNIPLTAIEEVSFQNRITVNGFTDEAIQAACNQAVAQGVPVVYLPAGGTYEFDNTVNVPAGLTILGSGVYSFCESTTNDVTLFSTSGDNVRFTRMRLIGHDMGTSSGNNTQGIVVSGDSNVRIDHCEMRGFSRANSFSSESSVMLDHCEIHHNLRSGLGYGVVITTGAKALISDNEFEQCRHALASNGALNWTPIGGVYYHAEGVDRTHWEFLYNDVGSNDLSEYELCAVDTHPGMDGSFVVKNNHFDDLRYAVGIRDGAGVIHENLFSDPDGASWRPWIGISAYYGTHNGIPVDQCMPHDIDIADSTFVNVPYDYLEYSIGTAENIYIDGELVPETYSTNEHILSSYNMPLLEVGADGKFRFRRNLDRRAPVPSDCEFADRVLDSTGMDWASGLHIGASGEPGVMTITNGDSVSSLNGYIGFDSGVVGVVSISGNGSTWTNSASFFVGDSGTGMLYIGTGGNVSNHDGYIGYGFDSVGEATVTGSNSTWINTGDLYVGVSGTGTLDIESGGSVSCSGSCYLGYFEGFVFQYDDVTVSEDDAEGTVNVNGAGANCAITQSLYIGGYDTGAGGTGNVTVENNGQLSVGWVLNVWSTGTMNIGATGQVTVGEALVLAQDSTLTAVSGSEIHMTGSAFQNESTNSANLAGLGNLKMIFEGGTEDVDPFEAAGEDVGAVAGGFVTANFLLDTLQLGGTAAGKIQLVDDYDNQNDGSPGNEAVYVNNLIMNAGATIDLNGLNLYYLNIGDPKQFFCGDGDMDGDVDLSDFFTLKANFGTGNCWAEGDFDGNGDVELSDFFILKVNYGSSSSKTIPEPASASLLLLGAVAMLRRRKK